MRRRGRAFAVRSGCGALVRTTVNATASLALVALALLLASTADATSARGGRLQAGLATDTARCDGLFHFLSVPGAVNLDGSRTGIEFLCQTGSTKSLCSSICTARAGASTAIHVTAGPTRPDSAPTTAPRSTTACSTRTPKRLGIYPVQVASPGRTVASATAANALMTDRKGDREDHCRGRAGETMRLLAERVGRPGRVLCRANRAVIRRVLQASDRGGSRGA